MRRWFTADLHLGHENILAYCERPFRSVRQMNATIIERINELVEPDDELWVLGDVALGNLDESLSWIGEIACSVKLISGNHDRCWGGHRRRQRALNEQQRYVAAGFDFVDDEAEILIAGHRVTLHHFPFAGDHRDNDRYQHVRPTDEGQWLLCGHVHDAWRQRGRQVNVGVDVRDFYPVCEEEVEAIIARGPVDEDAPLVKH